MEPKDAVRIAKAYVTDLFDTDRIINVGLEEIVYDDAEGIWEITIGFSRPWDQPGRRATILDYDPPSRPPSIHRDYRVVKVRDADGKVLSLTLRELAA